MHGEKSSVFFRNTEFSFVRILSMFHYAIFLQVMKLVKKYRPVFLYR